MQRSIKKYYDLSELQKRLSRCSGVKASELCPPGGRSLLYETEAFVHGVWQLWISGRDHYSSDRRTVFEAGECKSFLRSGTEQKKIKTREEKETVVKICIRPECGIVVLNTPWKETHCRECDMLLVTINKKTFESKFKKNRQIFYNETEEARLMAVELTKLIRNNRQRTVRNWTLKCFGAEVANDVVERVSRILEETIELSQAEGLTSDQAHKLIDYVYSRPIGEPSQEVGGISITLLAYCELKGLSADQCEAKELKRILSKTAQHFKERQNKKAESGVAKS